MPIMHFLREVSAVMDVDDCGKTMKCTVFEDNNGALEMSRVPKMRPRTKHVAIKYHHFRKHVERGDPLFEKVDAVEQEADFLTTPVVQQLFDYLRKKQ